MDHNHLPAGELPPDVSVVVAAYNVQAYIERAVRSALDQTGVSLEVIVVDDCSQDQTAAVLASIHDTRLRVLRQPFNAGPSTARNVAMRAARGAWIAVLDGDDAFAPGRLRKLIEAGRSGLADVVVDNPLVVPEPAGEAEPMFPTQEFATLSTLTLPALIRSSKPRAHRYPLHCTKPLFRTAFLRQHGLAYDETTKLGEDYLILAECLMWGATCVANPATDYLYTRRSGSISRAISSREWDTMLAADDALMRRHALAGEAAAAQRGRTLAMRRMRHYEAIVEALKQRRMALALHVACRHPWAALRLWLPFVNRLKRRAG